MDRQELILGALAAGNGAPLTPVKVQKLAFLLEKRIHQFTGGPHFNFVPYDYGPFDHQVYGVLESLEAQGLVTISRSPSSRFRTYQPTPSGISRGNAVLSKLPPQVAQYIRDLFAWIYGLSFVDLVSEVYRQFPEMKANSVFRY